MEINFVPAATSRTGIFVNVENGSIHISTPMPSRRDTMAVMEIDKDGVQRGSYELPYERFRDYYRSARSQRFKEVSIKSINVVALA